jgi:3-oxoacyl-[acyl-carrier protein] reductase
LQGKVVIITGASGGIGREIATAMVAKGAKLVLVDINKEELEKFSNSLLSDKNHIVNEVTDITNSSQVNDMVKRTIEKFGKIDTLVNCAGICEFIGLDVSEEQWKKVIDVNLTGAFLISKEVSRYMLTKNLGKIINIASSAGEDGGLLAGVHYSASKAGVISLTKSMAKCLAVHNIKVNAVSPGPTNTEMIKGWTQEMSEAVVGQIPLGRLGNPQDVVGAVMFLADSASNYITGQVIRVNGGLLM